MSKVVSRAVCMTSVKRFDAPYPGRGCAEPASGRNHMHCSKGAVSPAMHTHVGNQIGIITIDTPPPVRS